MKTRTLMFAALIAGLSGPVLAAGHHEYARVVDVEPIREVHRVPVDRQVCRDEVVQYREPQSHTPTVIGAILGGVFGSQFGSGSGRQAATAAGVLLGGSIGHDAARSRAGSSTVVSERCRVERGWQERTVTGNYRVTYEYGGRLHRTTLPYHPGDSIRVRVSVDPLG